MQNYLQSQIGEGEGPELTARERTSVGGEKGRLNWTFMGDRAGDAIAHVAGAGAALGALAAGPEDVGGTPGACPDGSIDFTLPNGLADADIHALTAVSSRSCDLLARGR